MIEMTGEASSPATILAHAPGMSAMPDPSEPDGRTVTRRKDPSTQAVGREETEVVPRATGSPTEVDGAPVEAEPLDETVEATDSARMSVAPTTGWSGAANPAGTQFWPGPGDGAMLGSMTPSRYQPIRFHARGGLGEIYVAVDGELNREVALKEIQERHGGQAESQFRFIFEAEVTGGLEHPGIVPVYGLGRHPDGRPYYAMRFIRGESLKAAIKHYHDATKRAGGPSPAHSLELRQLLGRFVAVCHAIGYAHSRGVLHRDIKPENIMLGPHGETLVVDWGLAKALNHPDPEDETAPKPLRPVSGGDTSMTMVGSVMGTPSFMSPEQAAGEIDGLGPGSDIFSLGSTLYALLTGQVPFRGDSYEDLIDRVKTAEFPPARSVNRAIPPALEAICRKAMARWPGHRYPTAAALAADIDRWMADEPVSAYREPWTARLARRAKRHRTAVAVSFALLLTASTALAISTVLIGRERIKTERNFQRARSAVEQMLTPVGEVELADIPQMEGVRRDLLMRAFAFYSEFLAERGGDRSFRREAGRANVRLGDIREMFGSYVQAEADYRRAIALLEGPTADVESRRALARARANLGVLLKKSNRFAESETFLRRALAERQSLATESPGDPDDARALASTRYQLGTLLARLEDRSREDEATYRRAIQEQQALVDQPSSGPEASRELARYLNNLGILLAGSDPDAAEAAFRRALSIQDKLQAESATNAGFRWQRARTWNNLANLYFKARLAEEAEPFYEKAKEGFESLAADFPRVPDYRRELAITLNNLGELREVRPSEKSDPGVLFRKARDDQRRLVDEFPEVPDHRMKLAITQLHIGDLLRTGDPAGSEAAFRAAIALQTKLVADYPQVPEYQSALGRTLTELASFLVVQGNRPEAVDLLAKATRALELAREGNPREKSTVGFLVKAHDDRAKALMRLARHADLALEAEQLAKVAPDRPEGHLAAAGYLARCVGLAAQDATLPEPRRREFEANYARDAVRALRRAFDKGQEDPKVLDSPDFESLKGRPEFEKLRDAVKSRGAKATV